MTDPWIELRVAVPQELAELAAWELGSPPGTGAVIGALAGDPPSPGSRDWVRAYLAPRDDSPEARAELLRRLARLAAGTGPEAARPRFRQVPDEAWEDAWKRHWKPFRVGRFAIVTPEFSRGLRGTDLRLVFEPGRGFETGRHPTTRSCLLALVRRVRPGSRVLDAGTGSGILSVAAALAGASECVGLDVDPAVGPVFEELARANGVADRCRFLHGSFDALAAVPPFDAVLANLYSDVLISRAREIETSLADEGWFVASGCPARHQAGVRSALERAGLVVERESRRGRWVTFEGRSRRDSRTRGGGRSPPPSCR